MRLKEIIGDNLIRIISAAVIGVMLLTSFVASKNMSVVSPEGNEPDDNEVVSFSDADNVFSGEPEIIIPEKPNEVSRARISVTGDVVIHTALLRAAYSSRNNYDFNPIYRYLGGYVSDSDYAVTNLETTLGGSKFSGYPAFNSPDSLVDAISDAGFDMLLTANNHADDTGYNGMHRTAQVLKQKKMDFIGTVEKDGDKRFLVREVNGIKIGMICYTYESKARSGKIKYLKSQLDYRSAKIINTFNVRNLDEFYTGLGQRMEEMRAEGAEVIVVFLHWGVEYVLTPDKDQKEIAQKLCDMGVDVISGGHPHVIQPVEMYTSGVDGSHRMLCIYSVGNSVSNQRIKEMNLKTGHTEDGVLLSFTFSRYSDGSVVLSDVDALPTWVYLYRNKTTGRDVFEILPLDTSVENWKEAYSLSEANAEKARKSYERTMEILGQGISECRELCRQMVSEKVGGETQGDIPAGK